MFEDDDEDDFEMSEVEKWHDDNIRYFDWRAYKTPGLPLDVELFYYSVYVPFKKELKEPLRKMVHQHYPYIVTECRTEILAKIETLIDRVGHEFILFLRGMVQFWKTGKDLREMFPKLDEWAISYQSYRKPRYMSLSFWDWCDWLTEEEKQSLLDESNREADEQFAFEEKPRSEFYDLLQTIVFKYYNDLQDLDSDGWVMFEVFLRDEYTSYQMDFEHYDDFIKYGFGVNDLDLPYKEYSEKYSERWNARREEELRKNEEENMNQQNEE